MARPVGQRQHRVGRPDVGVEHRRDPGRPRRVEHRRRSLRPAHVDQHRIGRAPPPRAAATPRRARAPGRTRARSAARPSGSTSTVATGVRAPATRRTCRQSTPAAAISRDEPLPRRVRPDPRQQHAPARRAAPPPSPRSSPSRAPPRASPPAAACPARPAAPPPGKRVERRRPAADDGPHPSPPELTLMECACDVHGLCIRRFPQTLKIAVGISIPEKPRIEPHRLASAARRRRASALPPRSPPRPPRSTPPAPESPRAHSRTTTSPPSAHRRR